MRAIFALVVALAAVPASAEESPFSDSQKSYAIPALEIIGFDVALNLFDRQYFGCCDFNVTTRSIRRNLRSSWGVDRDPFLVNQLGHPYQGSMYHGFARSAGLNYWEGLGYTFLASAMWEIAGETTPPSRNDQINTGIGGSFLGEALFRMASLVLEHPGDMSPWTRELLATAVSPPVGFNRFAFGDRYRTIFPSRSPLYFTRTQFGFSGTTHSQTGNSTTRLRRDEALIDFLIDYGLPGKPDYKYTRPFDYFSFQATASSANGFENAFTRGLLAGKEYSGRAHRGVWGVYGNYDYIAPQTYRVSSTGLSLGTTAQWWIDENLALVGTVMGGVSYTAAGTGGSHTDNPSEDVNFHYGLAPHALVALRLIYGERAALDLAAREYYVTRVGGPSFGGYDNIVRLEANLSYRIKKNHAVSVRYLFNRRDATLPGGDVTQQRGTFGLFYTWLGHDLFGAEKLSR
ncbi:MAG: DUF3943 domain-containing protein [Burkholderiales bacterium]|nr:DUF3943 domain-containing protein [Burkholderiales bacterium]